MLPRKWAQQRPLFTFLAKLGSAEACLLHVSNVRLCWQCMLFYMDGIIFITKHILLNGLLKICG